MKPLANLSTPHLFNSFLWMFFLTFQTASSTPLRPNIVFILADDLGWADTTPYGHTNFYQTLILNDWPNGE